MATIELINRTEVCTMLFGGQNPSAAESKLLDVVVKRATAAIIREIGYDPIQRTRTELYPRHEPVLWGSQSQVGTWDTRSGRAFFQSSVAGASALQVEHVPIRKITSVKVDSDARYGKATDAFASGTEWTEGDDFWAEWEHTHYAPSGILLSYGDWPVTPGSVQVTYIAGYSDLELQGDSTTASITNGQYNSVIDALALREAAEETVVANFHKWLAFQKKSRTGFVTGPLKSEKLGDYSYTVDSSVASNVGGFKVSIPQSALDKLEEFEHYGRMSL